MAKDPLELIMSYPFECPPPPYYQGTQPPSLQDILGLPPQTPSFQDFFPGLSPQTSGKKGPCLHPSDCIIVKKEYYIADEKSETGAGNCAEVKCDACHQTFNAEKSVEKVRVKQNIAKTADDITEFKYIEKVYWIKINPDRCGHINIIVSRSEVVDYNPKSGQVSDNLQYGKAKCKKCLSNNLPVRSRFQWVWKNGKQVKERLSDWVFYK